MSASSNNSMETVSFRRFLSYIYAYEDDTKLRNVGFAKVEVRPPRVRFQITVSGILQKGGRPLEMCLVDKNLQRIPVGQLILQNGHGEYRGSTGVENLWDSGLAFSQVYGICLQGAGNRRHYYMTLWKEAVKPVHPVGRHSEEKITVIPGTRKTGEAQAVIQAAQAVQGTEHEVQETVSQERQKAVSEEVLRAVSEEGQEAVSEEVQEAVSEEVQEAVSEEMQEEIKEKVREEYREELESASELMHQQSAAEIKEKTDIPSVSGTAHRQIRERKNGDKSMELWKKFCARYPHVDIRPLDFEEKRQGDGFMKVGKVCEAVRIRPNDIGRLPRNNWILAHNSFLQNAYNHYHQLILFRVENRETDTQPENRWFIGLPGDNSEQETLVAEVFGFKKYLKCKNGGFWYTEIMLG
ncbi:MAG: hypothetical protein SOW08_06075 [Lachnospiraceae bacterium]|nr:hypothetical protein [Lachnospiraceae bacterium]